MQAESWRSGITCRIAGAMAIISSEASCFFVALISIDRCVNIRYPYSQRKLRKKSSRVIVAFLWIISFALGVSPSVLSGENPKIYENSQVCVGLPLALIERFVKEENIVTEKIWLINETVPYWYHLDKITAVKFESLGQVTGMYYASAMFLGLNGICFIIIMLFYVLIVRSSIKSAKRAGSELAKNKEIKLTANVAAILITFFFCWVPVDVLGILVQSGAVNLHPSMFAWSVAVVLPINSTINPYLYTISVLIIDWLKQREKEIEKKAKNEKDLPRP
jgi:hypothetical protein